MARTSGSLAAWSMKASTDVANESYGWCARTSPARSTSNRSGTSAPSPRRRGCVVGVEAHHSRVAAAAAKLGLDRGEEVFGFAVDVVEITVSRHAEGMVGDHLHAWEQGLQVKRDDVFERDVALTFDQRDEAREDGRHLDSREMLLLALWVADQNRQVQREMRDVREGMAGIDGQRRQHRKDLLPANRGQAAP